MSLLTARQTADALGVTERTVRRWIQAGLLEAEKRRGVYAIDLNEARALFPQTRAGRATVRVDETAELRGRYLEAKERLERVEAELAAERLRSWRLERILYPAAELRTGAA